MRDTVYLNSVYTSFQRILFQKICAKTIFCLKKILLQKNIKRVRSEKVKIYRLPMPKI